MTSRRSRLKAVTNLPVRRKVLTVQGNTSDTTSANSPPPEKVFSCLGKPEKALSTAFNVHLNHALENNLSDASNKNKESVKVSCIASQKNGTFTNENDINKSREPENSEILESSNNLINASNLLSSKTDSNNSSALKSDHHVKLNSHDGRAQLENSDNQKGSDHLLQQYCTLNHSNSNSSNNNNNYNNSITNNIVEDGFKSYAVLTPQRVTLSPSSEYSAQCLTSCIENYIETSVSDVNTPQEYDEVQTYTEVEPTEFYTNNDINDNSESFTETEPLESTLTSLTNYNNDQELNCMNYENLSSNITELRNNSENIVVRPARRNFNGKNNTNDCFEHQKNSFTQVKDSNVLDRISSGPLKISPDIHSYKQISTVRRKRIKYNDCTKKLADAKREFQRKYEKTKPDRSSLKMIDLIFYNPSSNPMESKSKFEKKDPVEPSSEVVDDRLMEENVDEPEILDSNSRSNMSDSGESESTNKMPVPQVKIGLDGEIILDEKSLIIETTDAKKGREGLLNSIPIFEDKGCKVSYYRGKSKKTRDWADFETKRFYKALNTIGPDFTLMQKYFPKRSRLELKNKFKREERLNRQLIDKALNNPSEFDMTQLEKDLAVEKEAEEGIEMRFCKIVKQTAKKPRTKSSLLSREIVESNGELEKTLSKSSYLESKRLTEIERNKKEKEFDFVFQKLLMKESRKSGVTIPEISSSPSTLKDSENGVT